MMDNYQRSVNRIEEPHLYASKSATMQCNIIFRIGRRETFQVIRLCSSIYKIIYKKLYSIAVFATNFTFLVSVQYNCVNLLLQSSGLLTGGCTIFSQLLSKRKLI